MTAPSFVSVSAVSVRNMNGVTTITVAYPSSPVAGDWAYVSAQTMANGTLTAPTCSGGFTLVDSANADAFCFGYLFRKLLTGSESGTETVTFGGTPGNNNYAHTVMSYWHGQPSSLPVEESEGHNSGSNNAGTGTSVTTTGVDRLDVVFWTDGSSGDPGSSTPSGWTNAYNILENSGGATFQSNTRMIADYQVVSSIATIAAPTRTWTTGPRWQAFTMAFLPAPPPVALLGQAWL